MKKTKNDIIYCTIGFTVKTLKQANKELKKTRLKGLNGKEVDFLELKLIPIKNKKK